MSQYVIKLMLQEGEPSVSGGTKYPAPVYPSRAVNLHRGSRPDDKCPGDSEKILEISLPCACSQPGILIWPLLGLLGPRLFQGAPAQRRPTGAPWIRSPEG